MEVSPSLDPAVLPTANYWGPASENEFYASLQISSQKSFFNSPFGKIFTKSWLPLSSQTPRGLVFCSHGYSGDISWLFQTIPIAFARWNYATFAADFLGHGQSDGLPGYIEDVEKMAAASLSFFQSVRDRPEYRGLPKFLFGESMGGGVTFLMLLNDPQGWDGAIFSAPLFVMPEPARPSQLILRAYGLLAGLAETWAVMPRANLVGKALKDPTKARLILQNPRKYSGRFRVGTMRQLCRLCDTFAQRCGELKVPFITLHGTSDNVTAPEGSQMLYDKASSLDKTIKLYEGMYHSLIQAETDENVELVLSDIRAWIDERSQRSVANGQRLIQGEEEISLSAQADIVNHTD